ncbi:MAG: inorganic phosphate transporter [Candidatus Brocadiia bacterium]
MGWIIVLITAALGLYMAWNIGANDVANSMADAVGSKSISIKKAIIAAGICEFAGAVLVGSHVTNTVRKGIVSPERFTNIPGLEGTHEAAALLAIGMAAALLAAALWLNLATWMSMPVSTTHSIVGAIAGFGITAAGWSAVNWDKMGQIVASWFISPVAGGILAFIFFKLISWAILGQRKPVKAAVRFAPIIVFFTGITVTLAIFYKGLKHLLSEADWLTGTRAIGISLAIGLLCAWLSKYLIKRFLRQDGNRPLHEQLEKVEKIFAPLVIATSCCVAFAHGSNDVANAVGPIAAVAEIVRSGTVQMKVSVPFWILALGGCGITLGLAMYGYRVMRTVGEKITQITPSRGVAADVAATTTVLLCSRLGLPISTTHTLVGAILGVGLARGLGAVDKKVTRNIFASWLITVPAAAVLSMGFFLLGRAFLFNSVLKLIEATPA